MPWISWFLNGRPRQEYVWALGDTLYSSVPIALWPVSFLWNFVILWAVRGTMHSSPLIIAILPLLLENRFFCTKEKKEAWEMTQSVKCLLLKP